MGLDSKIWVAGRTTLAGKALVKRLAALGYRQLVGRDTAEPDGMNGAAVERHLELFRPEFIFAFAGHSAGILANQRRPAELMRENLLAASHILESAYRIGVKKLLYLASSCIYPRLCPQPMRPEHLMTGALEPTSQSYATAKLTGIELCRAYRKQYGASFISVIPADVFGPEDDFDPEASHVVPALIQKIHKTKTEGSKTITLWGSGEPVRDFIFSRDLADACIFLMSHWKGEDIVNISAHQPHSIRNIAHLIAEVIGYKGEIRFDMKSPDGTPEKRLDAASIFEAGWRPAVKIQDALRETYNVFRNSSMAQL